MPPAPHSPDPGLPALAVSVYAEVAVNAGRPLRQPFTYAVPPDFLARSGPLRVGHGVFVPFGRKVVQGVVLALRNDTDIASPRPIHARIDPDDPDAAAHPGPGRPGPLDRRDLPRLAVELRGAVPAPSHDVAPAAHPQRRGFPLRR